MYKTNIKNFSNIKEESVESRCDFLCAKAKTTTATTTTKTTTTTTARTTTTTKTIADRKNIIFE